jgi:hypothetical protein
MISTLAGRSRNFIPATESTNASTITTVGPTLNASSTPGVAGTGIRLAISSGGNILANGSNIGGTSVTQLYYINHTAYQENASGQWAGPVTASSIGSAVIDPTLPAALVAKSLTNWGVVFQDDFTTAATLQPSVTSQTYNSAFNWFANSNAVSPVSGTNYNTLTTTQASALSNGNSGGGPKPSPNGGLFQIFGQSDMTYNGNWATTVNGTPATGRKYKYFYAEAYIQYSHATFAAQGIVGGWPAWWSYSDANPSTGKPCECDFMEDQGTSPYWTMWDPGGGDVSATTISAGDIISPTEPNGDSNWHTYGFLWRNTGTNTGEITLWYDNVQIPDSFAKQHLLKSTFTTGTGGNLPDLDFTAGLWVVLGCGQPSYSPAATNKALNVDYVRIWQAIV